MIRAALFAWGLTAVTAGAQGSGTVFGAVYDSVHMRPLPGAEVQLVDAADPSRGWSAQADSTGSYRFAQVAAGRYRLGFVHAALDSLGLESPEAVVTVHPAASVERMLAIPSVRTLLRRLCRIDPALDSTGLFVGRVRHAADGLPRPSSRVAVSWAELRFARGRVIRAAPSLSADVDETGMFAICGVPLATPLVIRATAGSDSSGYVELDVPSDGLLMRDLMVGRAVSRVTVQTRNEVQQTAGLPWTMRRDTVEVTRRARGTGVVTGRVTVLTGAALGAVRVGIWATGLETETGPDGTFRLDSVPNGSQTLVARSIGFAPYRAVIDIRPASSARHDVVLAPFVAALDTVRVFGNRLRLDTWRSGFDLRRQRGLGEYLDEQQIARLNPQHVSDLVRDMPGVEVVPFGAFGRRVVMRSRAGGLYCVPAVFVDGLKFFTGGSRPGIGTATDLMEYTGTADLEYVVNALDIKAIEVYVHDSGVPPEFDLRDGCGSIVIWTGARNRHGGRSGGRD
jgi:hypothetical protein